MIPRDPLHSRFTPPPVLTTLILLTSLTLRIPGMLESLWFDEIFRTRIYLTGERAKDVLLHDVHNPLYNAIMYVWIRVFGQSEVSVRIPTLIAGYALTFALWRWAKTRFSPRTAWFTAAWLLLSPVPIWYGTEAKNSIVSALFSTLVVIAHDRLHTAAPDQRRRAISICVATNILAVLCDFQVLLIIIPAWLILLWDTLRARNPSSLLTTRPLITTLAASTACVAPWAIFKALNITRLARGYLGLFGLKHMLLFLCIWLPIGGAVPTPPPNFWPLWVLPGVLLILPLLTLGLRAAWTTPQGRLVATVFVTPILFYLIASAVIHAAGDRTRIFQERNLIVLLPWFPLVLFLGMSQLAPRIERTLATFFLSIALLASAAIPTLFVNRWSVSFPNPDWREAARLINAHERAPAAPQPLVIGRIWFEPLQYYNTNAQLTQFAHNADLMQCISTALAAHPREEFIFIHNPWWGRLTDADRANLDQRYPLTRRIELDALTLEYRSAAPATSGN